jgi:hypothetical protein
VDEVCMLCSVLFLRECVDCKFPEFSLSPLSFFFFLSQVPSAHIERVTDSIAHLYVSFGSVKFSVVVI